MSVEGVAAPGKGLLTRLAGPFREFGWVAGALYMLDRLLQAVSPRLGLQVYEFMVQPIGLTEGVPLAANGKPLLPASLAKNLSFQQINAGHPDIAQMPAREDIKAQRFSQGARCLGVYNKKGELIGYSWYCQRHYDEDLVRCTYELVDVKHSIFDFDLYVMPKHRLGVAFLGIWYGVNTVLAPQGVRYTFSRLARFNTASRRAHAHLGWKRVGRGTFFCAWGLELMFCTLAPFVAVTWGQRRVRLKLEPSVLLGAQGALTTGSHPSFPESSR